MPEGRSSQDGNGVPPDAVRSALHRVLQSHEFRASKRCQDFLRYAVETKLLGRADTLKERTIGVDVFGRTPAYDPADDATVRIKAGEVRKRLGLYYAGEGRHDSLRIELPAGTYVPEFSTVEPEPVAVAVLPPPAKHLRRWIAPSLLAGGLAVVAFWLAARTSPTVVDQFWSPVLKGPAHAIICAAYVPVYAQLPGKDAEKPRNLNELVVLTDQFVGGGDLIAVSRVSSMLTRMQKPYRLRVGNDVTFHDLRAAPAVLIGYSYTRWREISKELRFFIDVSRLPFGITDSGAPTKWTLPNLPPDRRTTEDYAIITRVFHVDTRAMMVEIAGVTQYGTDAAADVVTNSDLLAEALRGVPDGWQNKNLQIVLHLKVISGTPASPKVVATHVW